MTMPQTYATHRRVDPWYHYLLTSAALLALVLAVFALFRRPGLQEAFALVIALTAILLTLKVRSYALRVQDRVIRLEETLRMQRILPVDLQGRIQELTPGQFVALRFASDAELADRVREALDQGLRGEVIKTRIQQWRPDHFRV
ncbi:MAG: hypothetical protein H6P99_2399 [Holophagaceae bacterium]|nr:hypothetical protein [Holophagaceae bacterium]